MALTRNGVPLTSAEQATLRAGIGGSVSQIPYSTVIPLDGDKVMPRQTIAGAVSLTIGTRMAGGRCRLYFLSNGSNIPSIAGATEWADSFGYNNGGSNLLNCLDAWCDDGTNVYYAWSEPLVNNPVVTPVAPSWSSAPAVTSATVGSPVTFTSGAVSGTPTPTKTFRTTLDGSPIGTANTAYTPVSGDVGKALRIIETATNTAGTVDSSPSSPFTVVASGGLQAQTTDYMNRVAANGGTVSNAERDAVDAFFVSANAAGYLSAWAPRLAVPMGDALARVVPLLVGGGATLDIIAGGVTYGAATGWVTDGTGYIRTGYTPSGQTPSLGAYLRTAQTANTTLRTIIGCRSSDNAQSYRINGNLDASGTPTAGSIQGVMGAAVNTPHVSATGGLVAGLWHVARLSANSLVLAKNGVQLANGTTTAVTVASPAQELYVLGGNAAGTLGGALEAGSSVGGYFAGATLSTATSLTFYNHFQALMTALGRNV
ncbi:hypothetical protein [Pseudorhodoferax sp. Leaf274]|uniref:hypothetical protein n=1 Tax=Pseudorhodoferax sp. Leaf274 TaxID=1736318 RepID=UPI0007037963|nr:hypothetical protein [Pseudorhodoferax sp. Leaf274]KQP36135.1 hypothetical protein ASF44_16335 [Pseudorhodoferax sp. Leaf274]